MFDFLKKEEFRIIDQLKGEVESLKNDVYAKESRIKALSKYEPIVEVDELIAEKTEQLVSDLEELQKQKNTITDDISNLKIKYQDAFKEYQILQKRSDLFRETIELSEYGVYEPHFEFDTSEQYKENITSVRLRAKTLIQKDLAVQGGDGISWNGSLSQGQAMVKREKKLMLRAFNGESDSFIASVNWNNVSKMEERIKKSFEDINKVYQTQGIQISSLYKRLKLEELHLAYEYQKKKQDEKEEQRLIREQMREEEKAQREAENARLKAEKEEVTYQKALDKAKKDIESADGAKQAALLKQISELEERLKEAEINKERAISMAQQTKRGHVYVISNVGSFGENVYKIGMTRRLEPLDRVKELGDASVPFNFDVHALIFSEDAPALESTLHKTFESKRMNLINQKREFFKVSLDEIEKVVKEFHGGIEFTKLAEAQEYRETIALKSEIKNSEKETQDMMSNFMKLIDN